MWLLLSGQGRSLSALSGITTRVCHAAPDIVSAVVANKASKCQVYRQLHVYTTPESWLQSISLPTLTNGLTAELTQ